VEGGVNRHNGSASKVGPARGVENRVGVRRLGDCEFERADECRIVAYETHARRLSMAYVEERLATLRRVVKLRREKLERIADLGDWSLEVHLVAHQTDVAALDLDVLGLNVALRPGTFGELATGAIPTSLTSVFGRYVDRPLTKRGRRSASATRTWP
jgi:hypothetical protein